MKFCLNKPIVYAARDLERTLGLSIATKGYYIISNYTTFANSLAKGRKNILLIKEKQLLDTRELLQHDKTSKFINAINNAQVLVFKNTIQIEKICLEHDWRLLNPSAELSSKIEEKITQVEWLGGLRKYLPPFKITIAKEIKWTGEKFILQFNRAHTGNGTLLIESENQLKQIQTKFPNREVRVTEFVDGTMFTNNNIVNEKKVLSGNISYQITGLKPFTNLPFATVGNDWALPHKILSAKQKKNYEVMVQDIGRKMMLSGWKGLFGIDVMCDKKSGKLYLIEINARQPASTSFESQLQSVIPVKMRILKDSLTTFQAHLLALNGQKGTNTKLTIIKDGAQITQKVLKSKNKITGKKLDSIVNGFCKNSFKAFVYKNIEVESDWIRLQSAKSIFKDQNNLNEVGKKLKDFVLSVLKK